MDQKEGVFLTRKTPSFWSMIYVDSGREVEVVIKDECLFACRWLARVALITVGAPWLRVVQRAGCAHVQVDAVIPTILPCVS